VSSPDKSLQLAADDTVTSVTAAHRDACARARAAVADLPLEVVVTSHRAGAFKWLGCRGTGLQYSECRAFTLANGGRLGR
jgi:Protein of unknown function (DUF664)